MDSDSLKEKAPSCNDFTECADGSHSFFKYKQLENIHAGFLLK